jgi:ribosomal protein S18 acetylase RimI-like enzyme
MNRPIRIQPSQVSRAAAVLQRAFENYPLWQFMFPDPQIRQTRAIVLWEFFIRYGMKYGKVFVTSENIEGIAIWVHSDYANMTLLRQLGCGGFKILTHLGLKLIHRSEFVDKLIEPPRTKINTSPYWYLTQFAVDPQYHGQKFGSLLLRDMFDHESENIHTYYLETSRENNTKIYGHFGFEVKDQIIIPNTDVPIYFLKKGQKNA